MKSDPGEPTRLAVVLKPVRSMMALITRPVDQPLELQIVGRTLFHAALVGLGAGLMGCGFFAGAELLQNLLLEQLAGYEPLRAHGEHVWGGDPAPHIRLWLLAFIPAIGALIAGIVTRFAPECAGGGGDATIDAFHHKGGAIRRRVLWVKPLASIATLGSGGSGGREGPTMQIGGALGSTIGESLRVIGSNPELHHVAVAADIMTAAVSIALDADLRSAAQLMVARDLRSLPVIDADGSIVALVDEHDIANAVSADHSTRTARL